MTVDPFMLRGAAVGAAWRADRGGAAGAVYHAVGGGPLPIASGLPVVVTLLDLAPWELPDAFGRTVASRFGQRLRAQLLRDAAAVIVGSEATARGRPAVAPRPARPAAGRPARAAAGLPGRGATDGDRGGRRRRRSASGSACPAGTCVCSGRFDARLDLATLLAALAALAAAPAAGRRRRADVALAAARAPGRARARRIGRPSPGPRLGVGSARPSRTRRLLRRRTWRLWSAAPGPCVLPVVSEAAGLPAIEAIACGTPVVASAVGPLPELIGAAGLLVEPRDPDRLAVALDHDLGRRRRPRHGSPALPRRGRETDRRTWADVARETRAIYAEVGIRRTP